MKYSAESPRLPVLPFVVTDLVLLVIAAWIGWQASAPIGVAPLAIIFACVGLAAITGLLPLVLNFNRAQEDATQERANQIEALARTVSATADQVSIAAANLPATAATISQQLDAAKALPALLQSQIKDAQSRLAATAATENTALREEAAALRRELAALREGETTRLTAALAGITRATADLAAFEVLAKQHAESIDRLPSLTTDAVRQTTEALAQATATVLARIETAFAQHRAALAADGESARATLVTATETARATLAAEFESALHSATRSALDSLATFTPPAPPVATSPALPEAPVPPPTPLIEPSFAPKPVPTPEPASDPLPDPIPAPVVAPTPSLASEPEAEIAATPTIVATEEEPEVTATEPDPEPESASNQDDEAVGSTPVEPALSSDGLTRLIATAYIGIGNKLFIRGDGPGLNTAKGVPLQFVSIGKWRWESPELLFPATVRLYKNDQIECIALGEFTLEPGHHHEVNATF
jgi:hypothetical protein